VVVEEVVQWGSLEKAEGLNPIRIGFLGNARFPLRPRSALARTDKSTEGQPRPGPRRAVAEG